MVFPSQEEQIEKFEKDHVAQHYFEVLRTLISKKSVFAQQVGLKEVARYLGEIFKRVGAEVEIDETIRRLCHGTFQKFASRCQDFDFL